MNRIVPEPIARQPWQMLIPLFMLVSFGAAVLYSAAGGSMEPFNRVTLCPRCHQDEHKDRLRFTAEGGPYVGLDANGGLEFWRKDEPGQSFMEHREIPPHVREKD